MRAAEDAEHVKAIGPWRNRTTAVIGVISSRMVLPCCAPQIGMNSSSFFGRRPCLQIRTQQVSTTMHTLLLGLQDHKVREVALQCRLPWQLGVRSKLRQL